MTTWEYMLKAALIRSPDLIRDLNIMGQEGWEVVAWLPLHEVDRWGHDAGKGWHLFTYFLANPPIHLTHLTHLTRSCLAAYDRSAVWRHERTRDHTLWWARLAQDSASQSIPGSAPGTVGGALQAGWWTLVRHGRAVEGDYPRTTRMR